ncbi:MAG: hypothetical protein O2955_13095 [Planctomycetota bacterium]|nr:hypothetical protein [Planctomycetota bacterium]MDA1213446.1 hypothetical protein [Planctomycetota bacterium]
MDSRNDWRTSWISFVDLLEELLHSGADQSEIIKCFGGHQIQWNGTIESIDISPPAPNVVVALPNKRIDVGDGTIAVLDGLSLPISDRVIEHWRNQRVGATLEFQATLGSTNSVFPSIEVVDVGNGKSVVFVRIDDAVPVDAL